MLIFINQKIEIEIQMPNLGMHFHSSYSFIIVFRVYTKEAYSNIAYVKTIIYFRVMY